MLSILNSLIAFLALSITVWANHGSHTPAVRLGHLRRQEIITSDGEIIDDCLPSCELDTCGVATCGTGRREITGTPPFNVTESLAKREWKIGSSNDNQLLTQHTDWTINQVNTYVYNQVIHNWDNQYGALDGLFSGHDESAVSVERTFGTRPFQLGSNALHGCQVVTVVSKRAVWMAHFWESYTNGKPNRVETSARSGIKAFEERMIDFMTGKTVDPRTADPGRFPEAYPASNPTNDHPYLVPVGNPLDSASFNQPGDETKVFIMTPFLGSATARKPILKYQRRLDMVKEAMVSYLGDDITVVYVGYERHTDLSQQDTDQRGLALFQYDPNADGNGARQWRLFYENRVFQSTV